MLCQNQVDRMRAARRAQYYDGNAGKTPVYSAHANSHRASINQIRVRIHRQRLAHPRCEAVSPIGIVIGHGGATNKNLQKNCSAIDCNAADERYSNG